MSKYSLKKSPFVRFKSCVLVVASFLYLFSVGATYAAHCPSLKKVVCRSGSVEKATKECKIGVGIGGAVVGANAGYWAGGVSGAFIGCATGLFFTFTGPVNALATCGLGALLGGGIGSGIGAIGGAAAVTCGAIIVSSAIVFGPGAGVVPSVILCGVLAPVTGATFCPLGLAAGASSAASISVQSCEALEAAYDHCTKVKKYKFTCSR